MNRASAPARAHHLPDLALRGGGETYFLCGAIACGFVNGEAIAAGAGAGVCSPRRIPSAAGGSGLSALASSRLTCQICLSVSTCLKDGIPVSRMPLATFQYVSPGASSLTPTTALLWCFSHSGGASGNMCAPNTEGLPCKPWQAEHLSR